MAVAIDDGEAVLEGDLVLAEERVDLLAVAAGGGERGGGVAGWVDCFGVAGWEAAGDGVGFGAGVGGGVVGELEGHAVAVVAHLGDGAGEPALDGAVHEAVAEDEHEDDGDEADEDRSPQHAGAETGSHDAAALVGVELEDVADEHEEDRDEEDQRDDGEAGEDEYLLGGGGIEELEIEGVERSNAGEQQKRRGAEGDDYPFSPVHIRRHESCVLREAIIGARLTSPFERTLLICFEVSRPSPSAVQ